MRVRRPDPFAYLSNPGEPAGGAPPPGVPPFAAPLPGSPPFVPVSAAPPVTQPQPPQPPAAPQTLALPVEEAQRLYGLARQFEEFQRQQAATLEAEQHKAAIALAQKGEVEKAFNDFKSQQDQKVATLQTTLLNRERDLVVAGVLAGRVFVNDFARDQARVILQNAVEAALDGNGAVVVRDKTTGRPAADVLREVVEGPTFAHFLAAQTRGGSGASGGSVPAPTPNPGQPAPEPRNLGEAVAMHFLEARRQQQAQPFGAPLDLLGNRSRG